MKKNIIFIGLVVISTMLFGEDYNIRVSSELINGDYKISVFSNYYAVPKNIYLKTREQIHVGGMNRATAYPNASQHLVVAWIDILEENPKVIGKNNFERDYYQTNANFVIWNYDEEGNNLYINTAWPASAPEERYGIILNHPYDISIFK
jgi:hypothetical protein